jgi:general secretion pathway protein D
MKLHKTQGIYVCLLWLGVYLFAGTSTVQAARVKGEEGVKATAAKSASGSPGPASVASAQTAPPTRSPARPQPTQVDRQPVQVEAPKESKKANSSGVTINFSDTDITLFIKYISELTGKNFVVDEKVRGKVNIISNKEVSVEDAYRLFESVLEVNGFTTVPSGNITKIVPAVDARAKNITTKLREEAVSPEDRVETRLIQLRYADPEELKRTFTPLISKNSVMIDYPPTGMLIITDVKSNITRLLKIIDEIDVEGMGEQISVIPLEYATASEIAQTMNDVYQASTRRGVRREAGATSGPVPKIVPYDRTNDLIVRATETETIGIRAFIKLLDKETVRGEGDIHVRYLQNANAEDLAQTLASIRSGDTRTAKTGETPPIISRDVQIVPDKATNSLVIMAKKEDYALLEDIIAQLDITRRMVHIEALIMEVDVNKDLNLGVELQVAEPVGSHDGNDLLAFGNQAQGTLLQPVPGFTYGVLGGTITIGTNVYNTLGAVISAMKKDSNVYIKQTPSIMTTDNEEAEIVVAKNVPFQTRVETSTDLTGREFATYEYKDVGVILKITPQINQERFVRLKISLEVSQVVEEEQKGLPTTLKRQVGTTVIVKDAEKIVIGGLIDEILEEGTTQTPCLGDIPLLGWLFKTASRKGKKTNLYVFLEPHIVENPDEAEEIYREKREGIDELKDGVIRMYEGRPSNTEDMVLSDQGFELLESEDYDTAEGYFKRALEINPDNPFALLNLGVVYDVKGEREKAIKMYEKVIKLDPDDRAALSTNPEKIGYRLGDIAKDNLKRLR